MRHRLPWRACAIVSVWALTAFIGVGIRVAVVVVVLHAVDSGFLGAPVDMEIQYLAEEQLIDNWRDVSTRSLEPAVIRVQP
ncbi:MAG: hypothetical protein M2R45_00462 [Verrucomicrobia subdivision 3 bacterium]|nr:hypothetical protein [Limisphaerales bacterium]MCS1413658.1 hypothetical protein [Limisphaerales bacterium]